MATVRKGTNASARDVPKGLIWIDGIEGAPSIGWQLEGLCVVNHRITRSKIPMSTGLIAPLADIHSELFRSSNTEMAYVSIPDLRAVETVYDSGDILRLIASGIKPSHRHCLYKVQSEPAVYIPSLLIIRALFSGNKALDRLLMIENGIDYLGAAKITGDISEVVPGPSYMNSQKTPILPRIIAWTQLCADARRSHGSILDHAKRGEIGLTLPYVSLECWAWGIKTDAGLLVTEINGLDIRYPISEGGIVVREGDSITRYKSYSQRPKSPLCKAGRKSA